DNWHEPEKLMVEHFTEGEMFDNYI
ncbi:MAG: hypothetical protein QOG79_1598, partial [Mycobacterium sp.]|nr:hypothetical protein [Mycobacterium sp.]